MEPTFFSEDQIVPARDRLRATCDLLNPRSFLRSSAHIRARRLTSRRHPGFNRATNPVPHRAVGVNRGFALMNAVTAADRPPPWDETNDQTLYPSDPKNPEIPKFKAGPLDSRDRRPHVTDSQQPLAQNSKRVLESDPATEP